MQIDPPTLFHLLSDPTRLRMVMLLAREGELCVCELTHALEQIQPKISRHLALMRDAGLVIPRRQGQWIFYRLNPALPEWLKKVIGATVEGTVSQLPFEEDRSRLAGMPDRPVERCCV